MDRTFIICKPDAVERGLVGEILSRFERRNFRLVAVEQRIIAEATARTHYAEHAGKPFVDGLVAFMTGGPSVLVVVEGPENTWQVARNMIGATNALLAAPGTIRGDFGRELPANLIHGSDSLESADREIALFFPNLS
jgi:nucleoside-diphosphate kinase